LAPSPLTSGSSSMYQAGHKFKPCSLARVTLVPESQTIKSYFYGGVLRSQNFSDNCAADSQNEKLWNIAAAAMSALPLQADMCSASPDVC
jgi:hypothetical protein